MNRERTYSFIIDQDNQSTRIDSVLSLLLPETSRSFIQKLIEGGNLLLNGQVMTSKKYKTCEGDRIEIIVPEPEKLSVEPENIPLDIVYEDDDVLVVNKPKGMVVHPAVGNYTGTLVNAIMFHCADRLSSINGVVRPGIVHRIDKDTSGLLMIAKNNKAHESLSAQLAEHSITRRYKGFLLICHFVTSQVNFGIPKVKADGIPCIRHLSDAQTPAPRHEASARLTQVLALPVRKRNLRQADA